MTTQRYVVITLIALLFLGCIYLTSLSMAGSGVLRVLIGLKLLLVGILVGFRILLLSQKKGEP